MDFVIGSLAGIGAAIFTNPLDVLKTRMQLQGELQSKGEYKVHYGNVVHAGYSIIKHDGVLALQKGLIPALWVQVFVAGTRLGLFQNAERNGWITNADGKLLLFRSALVAGTAGAIGQFVGSPFFLVKTRLQSQSSKAIAVGHQHDSERLWNSLMRLYRDRGLRGLFRGVSGSLPRGCSGSAAQLLSFRITKDEMVTHDFFQNRPFLISFCGSMIGGVAMCLVMAPFDLVMTRLYNQPHDEHGHGLKYKHYMDCVVKIFESEGFFAFYKGVGPLYLRVGPHSMLSLIFWDKFKEWYEKYGTAY